MTQDNSARPSPPPSGYLCHWLTRRQEVFLLILLAVLVRMVAFNQPYTSEHWIKQLQVAPIAKNFYLHGYKLWWPEVDYSADRPNFIEIEFQLVAFLAALLYKLFGIHAWVGRLVTIGFSLGTMLLLYRLLRLHLGDRPALYGLLFFAFAPSSWFYAQAFMSEPAMLFFSVAAVYYFSRWLGLREPGQELTPAARGGGPWLFLAAAASTALAALVKLPAVIILLPLFYLAWVKWGWRVFSRGAAWLFLVIALAPAALYYHHAQVDIGRYFFTVGVGREGGMWFSPHDFLHPQAYSLMVMRLLRDHLTAVGVVLLPLGLFLRPASRRAPGYFFHVWLGAVLLYFVVVSGGNLRQTYYQLPLLLPAAAFLGLGWDRLLGTGAANRWSNAALVAIFLVLCAWGVQPFFKQYRPITRAAAALKQLDPSRQPVIILPPGYGCLYYFDRPGWVGRESMGRAESKVAPSDRPTPLYITSRIPRGAHWAVYFTDAGAGGARPDLEAFLRATYRLAQTGAGFEILDLTRPADPSPPPPPNTIAAPEEDQATP
jgi:4-amino-4-deoxy-L-arabinose transferase-like glycosyltransferase